METIAFVLFNSVIGALFVWAWSRERTVAEAARKAEIRERAEANRQRNAMLNAAR